MVFRLKMNKRKLRKFGLKRLLWAGLVMSLIVLVFVPLPSAEYSYSTVLFSREGRMLGASIADDGQWRFKGDEAVPGKFRSCLLQYEDKRFFYHPGIDPFAVARAVVRNLREGEVVSGASTLSMQLMRIRNGAGNRTYGRKLIEMFMALKLELFVSKREILRAYCEEAPFGGNVVGLHAAAWRYFSIPPEHLSWGESAALAVLPNAPSLVFPGRNEVEYKRKRNALLADLMENGIIDSLTFTLAVEEPLPTLPEKLPRTAPHLLDRMRVQHTGELIRSTIRYELQEAVMDIVRDHSAVLRSNHIHNLSAMVVEIATGKVRAYVGNPDWSDPNGGAVDMIQAERSSGSILKPFLYTAMLDAGLLTPNSLLPDLPIHFSGYSPQNFDLRFRGAVPASEALSYSLNLPAVWMLREYSPARFLDLLRKLGFSTFRHNEGHYGLSLILGGGEVRLDELVNAYAVFGRTLLMSQQHVDVSGNNEHLPLFIERNYEECAKPGIFNPASVYVCLEALKRVNRPTEERGWKHMSSSRQIAWKTGTSFGFRDAWAVGMNRKYVVGVWAGNADGEGRPGLTGRSAAAPVMFDIFGLLGADSWYEVTDNTMVEAAICRKSGHRAGPACDETDTLRIPRTCLFTPPCPYHQTLSLSAGLDYQVNMDCYPAHKIRRKSWFVLPPAMAWYYRAVDASYKAPPPFLPGCGKDGEGLMEFIYPGKDLMVFLPRDMATGKGEVVLEAAHRYPGTKIFWDLDGMPLGVTEYYHNIACRPSWGEHILTLTDEKGNMVRRRFRVVE